MEQKTKHFLEILSQDQLLGTIPSGLFLVDNERCIVYWNREAERMTGYSSQEVIGKHCSFLEGIECGNACGLFDANSPEKPIIGAECHIRTKSGEEIIISKNVDFLKKNNNVIGGIESFVDISRQKHQEETLRRNGQKLEQTINKRTLALETERTRLRTVLDGMSDMAYIVTRDFRITFLNEAMLKVFGPCKDKTCYEALHNQEKPCEDCPWSEVLKGCSTNEEREFTQNKRTYEIIHTPLHTPDAQIEKLAVCRDVTERKEAEEKLLELNRQLDSFAQTVSHDLRSPLTGIIGYTELIREEYGKRLGDGGKTLLQEVEKQGYRMLDLVEDLLDLSKVGHLPAPTEPVDTNNILKQVLQDNQVEILEKSVRIEYHPLPKLSLPKTLIYELISNLLLNAIRYGCEEGGAIEIDGSGGNNCHSLIICDHGPGIPELEREQVFDVFYRGSNSENTRGTGIGLATVHKIVLQYNGNISLEETPGGGCTVRIIFPVDVKREHL